MNLVLNIIVIVCFVGCLICNVMLSKWLKEADKIIDMQQELLRRVIKQLTGEEVP